jgi:hypothetical protein
MMVRIALIVAKGGHEIRVGGCGASRRRPRSSTEVSVEMLAILGVPWEQWLALAAASWCFAFVCFVAAFWPKRRSREAVPPNVVAFRRGAPGPVGVEEQRRRAA